MRAMSDDSRDNGDSKGIGTGVAVVFCVLLALYVLLLGPAARLHKTTSSSATRASIEYVYAPLVWLDERTPGNPLNKYVRLWQR